MRFNPTRPLVIGLASLCLAGCVTPSVILQCPPIPRSLTEVCEPEPRALEVNGDLAQALVDARECLSVSSLRLQAIAELADCRTSAEQPKPTR
jgi:hypothetical protein